MPKGKPGCFNCGQPTRYVIQVTLRDINYRGGVRERTINSVQRSFCGGCVDAVYEDIAGKLARRHDEYHGCGWCHETPTRSKVQLWQREIIGQTQRTAGTAIATAFCSDCRDEAYDASLVLLGGDTWNATGPHGGETFAGARARRVGKS